MLKKGICHLCNLFNSLKQSFTIFYEGQCKLGEKN